MLYIQLGLVALCPAFGSALLYWCNKKQNFRDCPKKANRACMDLYLDCLPFWVQSLAPMWTGL